MAASARTPAPSPEHDDRSRRILDAAEELLVAFGHRKVTVDDVARRAGIGKGTVYLHFPTKDELFTTALLRAQVRVGEHLVEVMRAGPEEILPSALARTVYLAQLDSPIVHASLTRDHDTLGTLLHTAARTKHALVERRARTMGGYFAVLREHGLLRPSLSAEEQNYAFVAIIVGVLLSTSLMEQQTYPVPTREVRADVLADTVRRTLEEPAGAEELRAAWPEVVTLFEDLLAMARRELGLPPGAPGGEAGADADSPRSGPAAHTPQAHPRHERTRPRRAPRD